MTEGDCKEKQFRRLTPESAERIRERAQAILRKELQLQDVASKSGLGRHSPFAVDDPIVQEIIESLRREVAALQKQLGEDS
jgi:hypothetical protein